MKSIIQKIILTTLVLIPTYHSSLASPANNNPKNIEWQFDGVSSPCAHAYSICLRDYQIKLQKVVVTYIGEANKPSELEMQKQCFSNLIRKIMKPSSLSLVSFYRDRTLFKSQIISEDGTIDFKLKRENRSEISSDEYFYANKVIANYSRKRLIENDTNSVVNKLEITCTILLDDFKLVDKDGIITDVLKHKTIEPVNPTVQFPDDADLYFSY